MKISGVVITYNEEANIERCLVSLGKVADELIVVDSFSTDKTADIAVIHGAKVVTHQFEGYVKQKNYAASLANHDFILSLDADEELSGVLINNLNKLKKSADDCRAYAFNRLTAYCGKWIRHCGWYPDRKVRLWDKKVGKWTGISLHEKMSISENTLIRHIEGDILHYSYRSIGQHMRQMDQFTTIAAQEAFSRNKKAYVVVHLLLYPFWLFVKNYILKRGFLDGYYGFVVCINGAYYKYLKYAKLLALKYRDS